MNTKNKHMHATHARDVSIALSGIALGVLLTASTFATANDIALGASLDRSADATQEVLPVTEKNDVCAKAQEAASEFFAALIDVEDPAVHEQVTLAADALTHSACDHRETAEHSTAVEASSTDINPDYCTKYRIGSLSRVFCESDVAAGNIYVE